MERLEVREGFSALLLVLRMEGARCEDGEPPLELRVIPCRQLTRPWRQFYSRKELNYANNLNALEANSSPELQMRAQPRQHLDFSLVSP